MDYLKFTVNEIHTVIAATVDTNGLPVTCAIDMMDSDESGLYFLTAKGKAFYGRLKKNGYIAFTGIKGNDTISSAAVSISGKVAELGSELLSRLFEKNSYMKEIYPTSESRKALTVFKVYEGHGELFDLSKKPIERRSFSFGKDESKSDGYFITDDCIACRKCEAACPQSCIDYSSAHAVILQKHCLRCGNCLSVCPHNAVIVKGVEQSSEK